MPHLPATKTQFFLFLKTMPINNLEKICASPLNREKNPPQQAKKMKKFCKLDSSGGVL
jgi:hypothetical protein